MSLTRAQAREIDRHCMEELHIPGIILMENASRGVADAAGEEIDALTGKKTGRILVICGGGNNGGDGLAAARHLRNRENDVHVAVTIDPAKYRGDALINWRIVEAMRLPVFPATPAAVRDFRADLIVDAIFGTGLDKPPRDPFPALVAAIEATKIPVLAVDLPSGLDCDTGQPMGPTIRARRTVTFVAPKAGFSNPAAAPYLGRITVADIGIVFRDRAETTKSEI